jgi:hypothetical protein
MPESTTKSAGTKGVAEEGMTLLVVPGPAGTEYGHPTRDIVTVKLEDAEESWQSIRIPIEYAAEVAAKIADVAAMGDAYREGERARSEGVPRDECPYVGKSVAAYQTQCYEWTKGWDGDGEPFFERDRAAAGMTWPRSEWKKHRRGER